MPAMHTADQIAITSAIPPCFEPATLKLVSLVILGLSTLVFVVLAALDGISFVAWMMLGFIIGIGGVLTWIVKGDGKRTLVEYMGVAWYDTKENVSIKLEKRLKMMLEIEDPHGSPSQTVWHSVIIDGD